MLIDGVTVTIKVAHMRLCHSRMPFVRAYPRETQEMVSTAAEKPATGRRNSLPPRGSGMDAGCGARLGTRAPRIAGVCQGALA